MTLQPASLCDDAESERPTKGKYAQLVKNYDITATNFDPYDNLFLYSTNDFIWISANRQIFIYFFFRHLPSSSVLLF